MTSQQGTASVSNPKQQASQLARQLESCRRLPTLPTVALQLVELASDNTATLDQFADCIAYDPALVGKLLLTANTSFYGHRRKVSSLSEAVSLLGLNATVALSLSFSLRGMSSYADDRGGIDDTHYWRRSLLTALAARVIATQQGEIIPEEFLLAGLLQDIGVLAMYALLGSDYSVLYRNSTDHTQLLCLETEQFGFDHVQAGVQLLKNWRLPERMVESVWHSHAQGQSADEPSAQGRRLSDAVAAAAALADVWVTDATAEAFDQAFPLVQQHLDIDYHQYHYIIESMGDKMPEMEALFETELVQPSVLWDLGDDARELLSTRTLQLSQSHAEADMHIQMLEERIAMLEEQAQRDALTGLYNRVYLKHKLDLEFAHARRDEGSLSLAFVDVDHFKHVNDTYGHAVGDQVLITMAHRLLSTIRQTDTVARYGGEEFIVLLEDTDIDDAKVVLERMLASVRDTPFEVHDGISVPITFSVGIAAVMPGGPVFNSPNELLDAADRALYRIKSTERGQISLYETKG